MRIDNIIVGIRYVLVLVALSAERLTRMWKWHFGARLPTTTAANVQ